MWATRPSSARWVAPDARPKSDAPPAAIGSIKANIGHTKAAAGVAGLIKAALALEAQIVPPTTGCEQPHPELTGDRPALRVLSQGELWPADRPLRAGDQRDGLRRHQRPRRARVDSPTGGARPSVLRERALLSSAQDAELFLLGGRDVDDLRAQGRPALDRRLPALAGPSSPTWPASLPGHSRTGQPERRSSPHGRRSCRRVWRRSGPGSTIAAETKAQVVGCSIRDEASSSGWAHCSPGSGSSSPARDQPRRSTAAAWRRRFSSVNDLYAWSDLPVDGDLRSTAVAQPAIVTASMAALNLLHEFGIEAEIAVGHSLGELTALALGRGL